MSIKLLLAVPLASIALGGFPAKAEPPGTVPASAAGATREFALVVPPPGQCATYPTWIKQPNGTYKKGWGRYCTPKQA